jgi:CubicO group peptidase (beta-lactamase class C family)
MGLPPTLFEVANPFSPSNFDDYFYYGPQFCPGGGQLMTCRDQLRVAQLLLNRGRWRDVDGEPFQLISEAYVDAMLVPHFPEVTTSYGFLTWLNHRANAHHCCVARWGNGAFLPSCNESKADNRSAWWNSCQ